MMEYCVVCDLDFHSYMWEGICDNCYRNQEAEKSASAANLSHDLPRKEADWRYWDDYVARAFGLNK